MKRLSLWYIAIAAGAAITPYAVAENATPIVKPAKSPQATLVALVPRATIAQFLKQLHRFSSARGFHLISRPIRPDQLHFILNIERSDAQIIALNPFDPVDPAEFTVTIYDPDTGPKLQSAEVSALVEQLQSALCVIKGVTCTQRAS